MNMTCSEPKICSINQYHYMIECDIERERESVRVLQSLTFLNDNRLHVILFPKHVTSTGCCKQAINVGNICKTSYGNKCQSERLIVSQTDSKPLLVRCPNSQTANNTPNPKHAKTTVTNSTTGSVCNCD